MYTPDQDIFRTQADTRFNSFTDPSAMAFNQMNGQWGMDPNRVTPAYTANYRPNFNGNQGNPYGGPQPGFFHSVNQTFNPFASSGGGANYGGNTYQQQAPYWDTMGPGVTDHGMNFAQKWVVPGVSSWLSYKFLAAPMGVMGSRTAAGFTSMALGSSLTAGRLATAASIAGGVGGFAASVIGPQIGVTAAVWAADKAIFDPYVAQRQTANDLNRNFAGVTFGDNSGNLITGKGFSRGAAAAQAGAISQIASKDFAFNQSEISNIADLSARAGLFDTVQGGDIAGRMRSITRQVKAVMQIANTSDFKDAIEIMSKLQTSGVAINDVTSTMTKLGHQASIAGVSVQKMMATVGDPGAYMFGANGMTPIVGAMTAANAYGAFSTGQRTGLISNAMLARMGGIEGAAQTSTAAMLSAQQTPFSRISDYNRYMNGGAGGGLVDNVGRFAGSIAGDPTGGYGKFLYHQAEFDSQSLADGGLSRIIDKFKSEASVRGLTGQGGSLKAERLLAMMVSDGIPLEQAKNLIERQRIAQDTGSSRQATLGIESSWAETRQKHLQTEMYDYGKATGAVRGTVSWLQDVQSAGSRGVSNFTNDVSRLTDSAHSWWNQATTGGDTNDIRDTLNIDRIDTSEFSEYSGLDKFIGGDATDIPNAIRRISSDKDLVDALANSPKNGDDAIETAISELVRRGSLEKKYASGPDMEKLKAALKLHFNKKDQSKPAEDLQTITGADNDAKARDLLTLGLSFKGKDRNITTEDISKYNASVSSGKRIGKNDTNAFASAMAKIGERYAGNAHYKEATEKDLTSAWTVGGQRKDAENAKQLLKDGINGSIDFSGLQPLDKLSAAFDNNTKALKVLVINPSGSPMDNMGNPTTNYNGTSKVLK